MKLNREQIIAVFGSAPSEQDGKKLVGVNNQSPLSGQQFHVGGRWIYAAHDYSGTSHPVAIYKDVAKHTTLEDLVGKDGQRVVWLIKLNQTSRLHDVDTWNGKLTLNTVKVQLIIDSGWRWSHSPFTPYADANEFKGGSNE